MILSYSRQFIFVKSRKTGGTSVEIALSALCKENDIISLITPRDEMLRLIQGRAFQNCLSDRNLEIKYEHELRKNNPPLHKIPRNIKDAQIFYNHMPISEIISISKVKQEDYYTFTIERHPYDKAVSFANFHMKYKQYTQGKSMSVNVRDIPGEVDRLIETGKLSDKIRNFDLYSANGKPCVNRILRYECLEGEFNALLREIGVEEHVTLPQTKVGDRDKSISPKKILTQNQQRWIQETCASEFDIMNYEF